MVDPERAVRGDRDIEDVDELGVEQHTLGEGRPQHVILESLDLERADLAEREAVERDLERGCQRAVQVERAVEVHVLIRLGAIVVNVRRHRHEARGRLPVIAVDAPGTVRIEAGDLAAIGVVDPERAVRGDRDIEDVDEQEVEQFSFGEGR